MAIKVLFLDFYGTLVYEDENITRNICRTICETSPQNIAPGDVAKLWWKYMDQSYKTCNGENFLRLGDIQHGILEELCSHFEAKASPEEFYTSILQSWQKPILFSDTRAFLAKLPLEICLVSNGDEEVLRNAFAFLQLGFDHVVLSESARSYKPDAGIFRTALEQMNVSPEEALFVGDSLTYDIRPAAALGMHTAWINRTGRTKDDAPVELMFSGLMPFKRIIR